MMNLYGLKILCIRCLIIIALILYMPTASLADEPFITARAAILIESSTGKILYEKNPYEPLYPASTTKVVTAILGLELGNIEDIVAISKEASMVGEASIYLKENQQVYLGDLIKGALVKSGNDAAYAIGEYIAGNEELFLMLMNKKAAILGAEHTSFHNTNGLPDKEHLSSAYDLGLIGRYAMDNALFAEYVQVKEDKLKFVSGETRYIKNTNKLLWNYPYATGIKTGTTRAAGQCLIASAQRDDKELIAVVLDSKARYNDAISLFEYGFSNWNIYNLPKNTFMGYIEVRNGQKDSLSLHLSDCITEVYPKGSKITVKKNINNHVYAPASEGTEFGQLEIYIDDLKTQSVPIVGREAVQRMNIFEKIHRLFLKN
ncbi:D-alanyl-D-alanine carboxypeptidase family protein [Desulfitibacter alkalitolerans]|uniref:D-alanyl-D-alanine carboxypeptidase family protein n=1 Tax=Desulfitibacter alkalitolerans TaxID=264641 RepID=UPI0006877965|nr:D-alanyl-D-alanine carboxypeptidase family protein [Desulfitibacter alkalitolerans]